MAITHKPPSAGVAPTTQAYHEFQLAYDFFNKELFDGKLPPCLITFQRKGARTFGYYARDRFASIAGTTTGEIALNPRHFKNRSLEEVMSTLVHEMVHVEQCLFGDHHSRAGYHNREWGGMMLRHGLHPSHTGAPGGRMTGQQMSHYIVPGGRFAVAVATLRRMLPAITWFDADAAVLLPKGLAGLDLVSPSPGLSGRRTVYRCPNPACRLRAESKSNALIICGHCDLQMQPVALR